MLNPEVTVSHWPEVLYPSRREQIELQRVTEDRDFLIMNAYLLPGSALSFPDRAASLGSDCARRPYRSPYGQQYKAHCCNASRLLQPR